MELNPIYSRIIFPIFFVLNYVTGKSLIDTDVPSPDDTKWLADQSVSYFISTGLINKQFSFNFHCGFGFSVQLFGRTTSLSYMVQLTARGYKITIFP